ncbi:UPF0262 family protein [Gammaproteobacteria bacterium]|nr:UPF0262 family protein [Gammaproteobacteria bacterium]|tara:strand:- start:44 stop:514 length:471 start_codon:yes stop_codon:yes gene_type:complete
MDERRRIVNIFLDERTLGRRSPEVEHDRAVAVFDLLENNYFSPVNGELGPFILHLSINENRLGLSVCDEADNKIFHFDLSLTSFRSVIKDYFLICESYYSAIKIASPSKIQAIDMARRSLHNDGSQILIERLKKFVEVDFDTGRQLFTLVCVLHSR